MKAVFTAVFMLFLFGCQSDKNQTLHIYSPFGNNHITFYLDVQGQPHYLVQHLQQTVIDSSGIGFEF